MTTNTGSCTQPQSAAAQLPRAVASSQQNLAEQPAQELLPPPRQQEQSLGLQPPVAVCTAKTLPAQPTLLAAAQQLLAAAQALLSDYSGYASGLVRLEVPVPRGCPPLWWLRGQGPIEQAAGLLCPHVYFSPRRSTAADTEGSAAAGAASRGSGSTAGAGAAWLWQGRPGEPLTEGSMRDIQRFLAASSPRVRAFGGARFDAAQQPAAEWLEFGSHCFFIPRVEYLEASGCNLLACTIAWDSAYKGSSSSSSQSQPTDTAAAVGFATLEAAVIDAIAALQSLGAPAPPAAGIFQLQRGVSRHTPDRSGWTRLMDITKGELNAAAAAAAEARASENALQDPETSPEVEGHGETWMPRADEEEVLGDDIIACTPLLKVNPETAREEYLLNGQEGLDELLAALDGGFEAYTTPNQEEGLTKVVLARRTDIMLSGQLEPLSLLEALQARLHGIVARERDPRAYQVLLQLPSGATFLGSTPECLYTRTGRAVASEAVAGTRARGAGGDVEKDFWLAFDLLRSHKDHEEFTVVRDWVWQALSTVCSDVRVDVAKSVLKQGAVQHLYGKLSGQLGAGKTDADLLRALHPTPAVCGRPREDALQRLAGSEPFDRGYYAGPFGWLSQDAAEFVVAIRSALVHPPQPQAGAGLADALQGAAAASQQPSGPAAGDGLGRSNGSGSRSSRAEQQQQQEEQLGFRLASTGAAGERRVSLYAGVGIVRGSDTQSEWSELDLKMRQFERLLQTVPPVSQAPNVNSLWAALMVEELCRLGCNTFCVAPGSRSSPLTVAIAQHPRARVVLCIDERSLGFWAMGFGRATGRPAVVVTSSGTAVANLLPSVVEAAQSGVPMLMLTADRPAELRDTGANQTIDQVKIFGSFTRWHADLPTPTDAVPARSLLSDIDNAARAATASARPGPVHLNCSFRDPLAPVAAEWSRACLRGLERWESSGEPFTTHSTLHGPLTSLPTMPAASPGGPAAALQSPAAAVPPAAAAALNAVLRAQRGLLVVGELTHPEDVVAAAQLARALQWPVAADVLSGLRAGVQEADPSLAVIHHMDHLLLGGEEHWQALRPDVVLQLGGHLTSKRLCNFLEWCALPSSSSSTLNGSSSSSDSNSSQGPPHEGPTPTVWVFVDRQAQRHDQSWLLSHRVEAAPAVLVAAVVHAAAAATTDAAGLLRQTLSSSSHGARGTSQRNTTSNNNHSSSSSRGRSKDHEHSGSGLARPTPSGAGQRSQLAHTALLVALDEEVGRAVDGALQEMSQLSEPHVARMLAQELPPGEGLFVGNSMPIRDLDMYARPAAAPASQAVPQKPQAVLPTGLGAPVAANRGASGIDGVLSSAAGFADGLGRGTTLVVGDLSFLHDINGLNLLRSGEMRPPLTVVLINNGGGGIFSFLPIADAVPDDIFTPLWTTPQHVDLAGMCRAQGVPHLKVSSAGDLRTALHSAWGLNRHSVIEVATDRASNVDNHRHIQEAARAAVDAALPLLRRWQEAWQGAGQQPGVLVGPHSSSSSSKTGSNSASSSLGQVGDAALPTLGVRIQAAAYEPYSLPLSRPLTTSAGDVSERQGFLLRLAVVAPTAGDPPHGSLIGQPVYMVSSSKGGADGQMSYNGNGNGNVHQNGAAAGSSSSRLSHGGSLNSFNSGGLVVAEGQSPSLVWGVGEVAPLPGLSAESAQQAEQQLVMLCDLLQGAEVPATLALLGGRMEQWLERGIGIGPGALHPSIRAGLEAALLSVLAQCSQTSLAGLLAPCTPSPQLSTDVLVNGLLDGRGSPAETATAAVMLVQQGYTALKVKVGRRSDPLQDAAVVLAVRHAVGPGVVLRADANRAWSLEQAAEFGRAAAAAGLQYIEEPTRSTSDLAEFFRQTGVCVALDETVDEGLVGPSRGTLEQDWASMGVAALVLKPTVLGGWERTLDLARWAQQHGMHAMVSSAFESPLGLAQLAQLAAVVDTTAAAGPVHHGLATLDWFAAPAPADPKGPPLAGELSAVGYQLLAAGAGLLVLGSTAGLSQEEGEGAAAAPMAITLQSAAVVCSRITGLGQYKSQPTYKDSHKPSAAASPLIRGTCMALSGGATYSFGLLATASTSSSISGMCGSGSVAAQPAAATQPPAGRGDPTAVVFLHGFMGSGEDWAPYMAALTAGRPERQCIALDLPGHGATSVVGGGGCSADGLVNEAYSLEATAAAVTGVVEQLGLTSRRCAVVGYSLGARLALLLATRWPSLFAKAVVISGTPGISGPEQRAERAERDASLAESLRNMGTAAFLESWYQQPLWESLRHSPRFHRMLSQRAAGDPAELSTVLASMSPGRAPSLWRQLAQNPKEAQGGSSSSSSAAMTELLFVAGELDAKFVQLGRQACEAVNGPDSPAIAVRAGTAGRAAFKQVPGCGHAVQVERPLELLAILEGFLA
ncbi:hypothetical protein N2152v2_004952 [Parachlorella kessleri]